MDILYKIALTVDSFIYSLIGHVYEIFMALATKRIFGTDSVVDLMQRMYIIVGVFMLFIIAYSLITAIINPEEMGKGNSSPGKIIQKIVIALAFLMFVPTFFNFMYTIQSVVLDSNVIPNILLGGSENSHYMSGVETDMGKYIARDIFESFFFPTQLGSDVCVEYKGGTFLAGWSATPTKCLSQAGAIFDSGEFWNPFYYYTYFDEKIIDEEITYIAFISGIVGILVLALFASFAFDMAVRIFKLAFLQIIAPIPILYNILPSGDKVFQNWIKKTLSTFFEVFLRLLIIYFIAYIMGLLPSADVGFSGALGLNWFTGSVARVLVVLGLIIFAKTAPKFITDLFGIDGGGLNMGIMDKLKDGLTVPFATAGARNLLKTGKDEFLRHQKQSTIDKPDATTRQKLKYSGVNALKALGTGMASGVRGGISSMGVTKYDDMVKSSDSSKNKTESNRKMKELKKKERDEMVSSKKEEFKDINTDFDARVFQLKRDMKNAVGLEVDLKAHLKEIELAKKLSEGFLASVGADYDKMGKNFGLLHKHAFDENGELRADFDMKGASLENIKEIHSFDNMLAAEAHAKSFTREVEVKAADEAIISINNQLSKIRASFSGDAAKLADVDRLINIDSEISKEINISETIKKQRKDRMDFLKTSLNLSSVNDPAILRHKDILEFDASLDDVKKTITGLNLTKDALQKNSTYKDLVETINMKEYKISERDKIVKDTENKRAGLLEAIYAMSEYQKGIMGDIAASGKSVEEAAEAIGYSAADAENMQIRFEQSNNKNAPLFEQANNQNKLLGKDFEPFEAKGGQKRKIDSVGAAIKKYDNKINTINMQTAATDKIKEQIDQLKKDK